MSRNKERMSKSGIGQGRVLREDGWSPGQGFGDGGDDSGWVGGEVH